MKVTDIGEDDVNFVTEREALIRQAISDAIDAVGLDVIKRGPFFGIGESRRSSLQQAA